MSDKDKASLWQRMMQNIRYCISGVWNDRRTLFSVKAVKIVNLSVRSFMDRDLQMRSRALTYNTVLAVVPALAMLFAIARGFGFQNLMQSELFKYFPAQREVLESALTYVDNYLSQASQGIFIGIGLIFLLWTLLSLMSNVEDTFNHVWGVTTKRSIQRKFTDYTALFLLLPVLMVCSAGISIFLSDAVQTVFENDPITPMMHRLLALMPLVISWLVFTAAYYLIPNTKVSLKGALFAGVLCGTLFHGIQWLFVTGQVYVSKYNAIYGSFAFLPLMLVWLQLSWLITLSGVVLTYAWQNFDSFDYNDRAKDASQTYANSIAIAVLAQAVKQFKRNEGALKRSDLISKYDIPSTLADRLLGKLQQAGLINKVSQGKDDDDSAYQPAFDPDDFTVNDVANKLSDMGNSDFIPKADSDFAELLAYIKDLRERQQKTTPDIKLLDLP
jgi:membrane protein